MVGTARSGRSRPRLVRVCAPRRDLRRLLLALFALVLATACAGSGAVLVEPPNVVADADTETAVGAADPDGAEGSGVPVPEPSVEPTPTVAWTPTPLPTPTPTPKPLIPTDILEQSIDENFAALDELGLTYSFQVSGPDGVVAERNARSSLLPASNQKVVTAMGALELLPEDFRFVTEVRMDSTGTVTVVGGGDPTLTQHHIRALADEIVERLTSEVGADLPVRIGDLVVDTSHFPPTRVGPGWPPRYVPGDVGPMSGLMIDNNQHRGDDAYVADPDAGNAFLIGDIFVRAGMEITGVIRLGEAEPDAAMVARRESPALAQLVELVLGRSDNEVADALVREIGRVHAGVGEIEVGQELVFEHLAQLGVDLGAARGDGSGLSRDNRLSAADLVALLDVAHTESWWPVIEDGLAAAGVDGTLAARLETDTTVGNVRAKTGTLDDVRALSGVLTTVDGRPLIFSFLINGEEAEEGVEAMDQIVVAYASARFDQLVG